MTRWSPMSISRTALPLCALLSLALLSPCRTMAQEANAPPAAAQPPVAYASVNELNGILAQVKQTAQNMQADLEKTRIDRQIGVLRNAIAGGDRDYIDAELQELGRLAQAFAERRMDRAIGSALKGKKVNEVNSS